jgi:hypothetical protein
MYYGYIPYEVTGDITSMQDITIDMLKNPNSKVVEAVPGNLSKTSLGVVPEACFIVVAVPAAGDFLVTKDNGLGGKVAFNEDDFGANNATVIYNNIEYKIFGELAIASGERFIYID